MDANEAMRLIDVILSAIGAGFADCSITMSSVIELRIGKGLIKQTRQYSLRFTIQKIREMTEN